MLKLPESMREILSKPHGRLYKGDWVDLKLIDEVNECELIACVGDLVSLSAINSSLNPHLIVLDGKTLRHERLEIEDSIKNYKKLEANNPPGYISCDLVRTIQLAVKMIFDGFRVCIWIHGEEDLAVMPLGLVLPENSLILYGQPREGVVALVIDKEKKILIANLMRRMEKILECKEIDELLEVGKDGNVH